MTLFLTVQLFFLNLPISLTSVLTVVCYIPPIPSEYSHLCGIVAVLGRMCGWMYA